jgi:thiosulfate/3-mercaptopyruvate sulfurtransferase
MRPMTSPFPEQTHPLVSTAWLAENLGAPDLRVLDGTYSSVEGAADVAEVFAVRHIPGAAFFDIREIRDKAHRAPLMLPDAATFAAAVGALGISNEHRVVVYDSGDMLNAGRVWWMFRTFGHGAVAVLDGGLPKWLAEGRPTDTGKASPVPAVFRATLDPRQVRTLDDMRGLVADGSEQVLDVREHDRFVGAVPEKRPGLRIGHMPGARNLPYQHFKTTDNTLPDPATLRALFAKAGVEADRPVVTTCGGGVAAGLVALGLERIGHTDWALYDGSWSEWAAQDDTPIDTGEA